MSKHRSPRTILTEYFATKRATLPVKITRSSTPVRAIQHALRHLIQREYGAVQIVVISTPSGKVVARIIHSTNGWNIHA
jgi:hypothetical protein